MTERRATRLLLGWTFVVLGTLSFLGAIRSWLEAWPPLAPVRDNVSALVAAAWAVVSVAIILWGYGIVDAASAVGTATASC